MSCRCGPPRKRGPTWAESRAFLLGLQVLLAPLGFLVAQLQKLPPKVADLLILSTSTLLGFTLTVALFWPLVRSLVP